MGLDHEQLASKICLIVVLGKKPTQARHQCRNRFRVIVQLQRDDAAEIHRRIPDDVGEVPVQRQQYPAQSLGSSDDVIISGVNGQMFLQQGDIGAESSKVLGDLARNAMIAKEPQVHAVATAS